jgi:hypothetical protein
MREHDGSDVAGVRIVVFSLTLALVPLLGLVWVRYVWLEAGQPGVTAVELVARSAAVAAAGLLGWATLRLAGGVLVALARSVEALRRRSHP